MAAERKKINQLNSILGSNSRNKGGKEPSLFPSVKDSQAKTKSMRFRNFKRTQNLTDGNALTSPLMVTMSTKFSDTQQRHLALQASYSSTSKSKLSRSKASSPTKQQLAQQYVYIPPGTEATTEMTSNN